MSLRTHLASNGDGRENAIVELPECREYPELQQRVFANAYFSKQKSKKVMLKLLLIGYGNAAAQLHGAARVLGRWRAALWAKGARCAIVK